MNALITFCRILGSTVSGTHSAVLEGLEGNVTGLGDTEGDEQGEKMDDTEVYGALGLIGRPRKPEQIGDELMAAEAMGVRQGGIITPLARRDLRLNRRFPAPAVGTVALVGYGGGFLSFDDAAGDTTLVTLKVPYARDGSGNATKNHVITVTPAGTIKLLHGDGGKVELKVGGSVDINGVIFSTNGDVTAPGEVTAKSAGVNVKLSTHVHPSAMGPTGSPTPGS